MEVLGRFLPDDFHMFSLAGVGLAVGLVLTLFTVKELYSIIYNLYFHPLAHIPGPFWNRASPIPFAICQYTGAVIPFLREAHAKHGDAIRVSPSEVSFISGETAWQDMYGFRGGKTKTPSFPKDQRVVARPVNGVWSVLMSDPEDHTRMRRNLSHAFSDKAMKAQEPLVQAMIDLLISRLHEQVEEGKEVLDIVRWYNYTTFDIITDLTYGEPLYCLRDKDYHPWVELLPGALQAGAILAAARRFPLFSLYESLKSASKGGNPIEQRVALAQLVESKVSKRIEQGTLRPDFMTHILANQETGPKGMTRPEIDSNAILLTIAGSETTATQLSGFTYGVGTNPDAYAKLVGEIRSAFKSQDEINIDAVNRLEYLGACLAEGLRIYPPVPTGFNRLTPKGGAEVSGYYLPEGTSAYMSQYTANHSPRNFTSPDSFVPERWLGDPKYANDKFDVVQPFSFGPRNCLGKNLAYAEMRLIIAKMFFNFDVEIQKQSMGWWIDQKVYGLWEKPDLWVKLTAVQR